MAKARSKQSFWNSRKQRQAFWHSRAGSGVELLVSVALAYILGSMAINSGSLIQYFLTFVLIGIAINRIIKVIGKK